MVSIAAVQSCFVRHGSSADADQLPRKFCSKFYKKLGYLLICDLLAFVFLLCNCFLLKL